MATFFIWLPYILQFVSWILGMIGASKNTMDKFMELVTKAQKYGLITVEIKDRFADQRTALLRRKEEREKAKALKP